MERSLSSSKLFCPIRLCIVHIAFFCYVALSYGSTANITILIYGIRTQQLLQSLPYTAAGFDLGLRDANRQFGQRVNLTTVYVSNQEIVSCDDTGAYFDHVSQYYYSHSNSKTNSTLALFYPSCDESTTLAQLGREWDILALSSGTTFSNMRSRTLYPTTIMLGPVQYEIYGVFIKQLLRRFSWTSVGFVYDISGRTPFNRLIFSRIHAFLRRFAAEVDVHAFPIDFRDGVESIRYRDINKSLLRVTRVVFISVPHPITRNFLVMAHKMGLHSGEVTWMSLDVANGPRGNLTWIIGDGDDEVALAAFRSVFKLETCYTKRNLSMYDQLVEEFRQRSQMIYNVTYPPNTGPSEYVVSAYAAMILLTQIVNESREISSHSGSTIARSFLNRTFLSDSFGEIYINDEGERQNEICLMDFNTFTQSFQTALFYFEGSSLDVQEMPNISIDWNTVDKKPPSNEPPCGFHNEKPECRLKDYSMPLAASLTAFTLAIIFAGATIIVRRFQHQSLSPTKLQHDTVASIFWWILDPDQLTMLQKHEYEICDFWNNSALWKM